MQSSHLYRLIYLFLGLAWIQQPAFGQTFLDVSSLLNAQPTLPAQAGASIIDFNNDGLMDLYHPRTLYRQRADGTFAEVLPRVAGTAREAQTPAGAIFGDVNNDGYLDVLFEDATAGSIFHINQYNNIWVPANETATLPITGPTQGTILGDFNNDGWLDLFVNSNQSLQSQLFINQGEGTFRETSDGAGVVFERFARGASASDYDRDGDLDLYLAAFESRGFVQGANLLLQNQGDATFVDVAQATGTANNRPTQGVLWWDYNNDGWMDLYIADEVTSEIDFDTGFNRLMRNDTRGGFIRVETEAGVSGPEGNRSYTATAADFDNDGWLDLYVGNLDLPPNLYHNNGDGTFTDIWTSTGIRAPNVSRESGLAVADVNGDGWIDLFHPSTVGDHLYYNEAGTNHWLKVALRGQTTNAFGIGARVEVYGAGLTQVREINAGEGLSSQSHGLIAHFGLGTATQIDSIVVRWPGGGVDRLFDVATDQMLTLVQSVGINQPPTTFELLGPADGSDLLPVDGQIVFTWKPASDPENDALQYTFHLFGPSVDTAFTDLTETRLALDAKVLAPNIGYAWTVNVSDGFSIRNSTDRFVIGGSPAATVPEPLTLTYPMPATQYGTADFGDYDGDGDLDLLMTGLTDAGPMTRVYQLIDSLFTMQISPEEVDTLIFKQYRDLREFTLSPVWRSTARWGDFDQDGDLDIASIGIFSFESTQTGRQTMPILRIYEKNDFGFNLLNTPDVPGIHSGALDWADYDGDGDLDLLMAGASQIEPPYEPITRIIRNDNGQFTEIEAGLPGIMTGEAVWADYDGDGDLDITLLGTTQTGEYLTRIYRNDGNGLFTESPVELPALAFGSLDWGDYDADGDLDLLLTGGIQAPEIIQGITKVYRNEGNGFLMDINVDLVPAAFGKGIWTDYDGDGDLDIFLVGAASVYGTRDGWIYRNDEGFFLREFRLGGATFGDMVAGDYNADGDIDFLTFGTGPDGKPFISFFVNRIFPDPIPPSLLSR